MKKALILLALLALASLAFAEFKNLPPEAQKNLGAIKKYPKTSSIVLWSEESYVLRSDGSKTVERHIFRYLPDEAARDNFGDPRVPYVVGRDSLMVLVARAYTADGRTVDCTPQNAFNPVVPDGLDKAPDYAPIRQMVITLMGLENGCITELHYRLNTPKPLFPWLEGRVYLRDENPVIAQRVTVQVPEGQTLSYKVDRGAPEPAVTGSTYSWTVGEQTGYDKQDLQGHRILLPNIAFTTAHSWEQIQTELKARFDASAASDTLVPASLVKALAGVNGDENRFEVIQSWARDRFNHVEFELPDFVLNLRPVRQIVASGYGNGLELAAMVSRLADLSGLSAQVIPCFVPPAPVPFLCDVSTALVALRTPNGVVYSDPLRPRTDFGSAEMVGYTLIPLDNVKEAPAVYTSRVKNASVYIAITLEDLAADTIHGSGTLSSQGEFGMYELVRDMGPEAFLKRGLRYKGMTVTKAVVKDLDSPRHGCSVTIDFSFTAPALDTADHHHILPLSLVDFGHMVSDAPLSLPTREFRQDVSLPAGALFHFEAAIPDGWEVKDMPKNLTRKWDFDEGVVKSEVKDGRFVFERSLKLSKEWIPPESWSQFRTFMLESGVRPDNSVTFGPKAETKVATKATRKK